MLHPGHIVGPGWLPINPAGNLNLDVFERLATGEPVLLPNVGLETLHHVHADDVAQAFDRAVDRRAAAIGESFHVTSERAITLRGYAEAVAGWYGREPNLELRSWESFREHVGQDAAEATWDHIAHSPSMSIDKARALLGYARATARWRRCARRSSGSPGRAGCRSRSPADGARSRQPLTRGTAVCNPPRRVRKRFRRVTARRPARAARRPGRWRVQRGRTGPGGAGRYVQRSLRKPFRRLSYASFRRRGGGRCGGASSGASCEPPAWPARCSGRSRDRRSLRARATWRRRRGSPSGRRIAAALQQVADLRAAR